MRLYNPLVVKDWEEDPRTTLAYIIVSIEPVREVVKNTLSRWKLALAALKRWVGLPDSEKEKFKDENGLYRFDPEGTVVLGKAEDLLKIKEIARALRGDIEEGTWVLLMFPLYRSSRVPERFLREILSSADRPTVVLASRYLDVLMEDAEAFIEEFEKAWRQLTFYTG